MVHTEAVWHVELPGVVRSECQTDGVTSMIPIAQRDDVEVTGERARHENGQVVRFRARVDEITDLQITWHLVREVACILSDIRMQINGRRMLQCFILPIGSGHHLGMAMTDADRHDSSKAVEIPPALLIEHVLAATP